jgi:hypothetical protein
VWRPVIPGARTCYSEGWTHMAEPIRLTFVSFCTHFANSLQPRICSENMNCFKNERRVGT